MTLIGIDPHKATHTAVAINDHEEVIAEVTVRASTSQVTVLQEWAAGFNQRVWAVESAYGLGYLVAQQLTAAGETVFDVPATLSSRARLLGTGRSQKNDVNDARSVAVAALRSDRLLMVRPDDHARMLRLLVKRHRDMTEERVRHGNRLHALVAELEPGGISSRMTVPKARRLLDQVDAGDETTRYRVLIATEVMADIARLDKAVYESKKRITAAVTASGTTVTEITGIGPVGAGIIIGMVGDVSRFANKAHFASYNGTAPIEASSGHNLRHRLNPGGNRVINHALHIAAVTQIRYCPEGRAYYERKRDEGKSPKEAKRALKRRISDRVFRHLVNDATRTNPKSVE